MMQTTSQTIKITKRGELPKYELAAGSRPSVRPGGVVHFLKSEWRTYVFAAHSQAYCSIDPELATLLESLDGTKSLDDTIHLFSSQVANNGGSIDRQHLTDAMNALYSCGVLSDAAGKSPREIQNSQSEKRRRLPTPILTLALTSGCNLGCSYCYASAADNPKEMSREVWTKSIEHFVTEWIGRCRKATLCLHGGGEPTLNPRRLIEVIDLFCQQCEAVMIEPFVLLQTNGAFAPLLRDLVVRSNVRLSISLDGDAQVQDYQRPFLNGKSSFDRIIENIKFLTSHGKEVGILSTVTRWSLDRMTETVTMAKENGISGIHFEPIEVTGRAEANEMTKPDLSIFASNVIECIRLGAPDGIRVTATIDPEMPLRTSFCGVADSFPLVTPEGHISTCVEVLEKSDPLAETFFIGKVTDQNLVQISPKKVAQLDKRHIEYIPHCDSCFLKRQCAGGCPARSVRQKGGDLYTLDEPWCDAMRTINEATIRMVADGEIDPSKPFQRQELSLGQPADGIAV